MGHFGLCRCDVLHVHLPITVPPAPSQQAPTRAGLAGGQGRLKLLPPCLHWKDYSWPHSPARDPAHCLQAAGSLTQQSPGQNWWLVMAELTSCRFGKVWSGGTPGNLCPGSLLQFMHAAAVFSCLTPLFVWRLEGVKCYIMISMIAIILLFTQDILLEPLPLFSEGWGNRVCCDSRTRFSLQWCKL